MSDDRPPMLTRLFRACLLVLGSVFCLWLAVQLLSQIWMVVLIVIVAALLLAGLIWWLRMRRNRW